MKPIFAAIHDSLEILDLPENWDEEGGLPVSRKAYSRAISFLFRLISDTGPGILPPYISQMSDGRVIIYWKPDTGERLLLCIGENTFSWYGHTGHKKNITKGSSADCFDSELEMWINNHMMLKTN